MPDVGALYIIGGAEDKIGERAVLRDFVAACGGERADIAVVPTASSLGSEVVDVYAAIFARLGARRMRGVRPETRAEADDPGVVEQLDGVTGVFLTGGNQLKLSAVVNGTRFASALIAAHHNGVAIGGTSAGASAISSHMVAFGTGGSTPKQRMTQLAAGLGLLDGCVIDQHFAQRNRYGRLLTLVAQSPSLLGIGVDEDTAAVVTDDRFLEVIGRGAVTVVDGHEMTSNAYAAKRTQPLMISGARLHVLPAGSKFDLMKRALRGASHDLDPSDVEELNVANADLANLARDIAAEGVWPTKGRRRSGRRRLEREDDAE